MSWRGPEALTPAHRVDQFENRHASLVEWLQRRAMGNEEARASRTFVVCHASRVVGYYALAAGAVEAADLQGRLRRNLPRPLPAIVLGRLAMDTRYQGKGLGSDLLRDAVMRSLVAGRVIGARVLFCHALDAAARDFYLARGFVPSPTDERTVLLDLNRAAALLRQHAP